MIPRGGSLQNLLAKIPTFGISEYYRLAHPILRINPSYLVRFTADFLKMSLKSSSESCSQYGLLSVSSCGCGSNSGSACAVLLLFHGQTSWHISQPNIRSSSCCGFASVNGPRCSIVQYERHLRASTTPGCTIAPVGHESMQRVQLPHKFFSYGASGSIVMSSNNSDKKKNEPCCGLMSSEFLPIQPSPPRPFALQDRS